MSNIYIAGVGMTKFGRHIERTLESLTGEAIEKALGGIHTSESIADNIKHMTVSD